ncbi:MAG: 2-oxo-tetronate isomerase [Rhodoferax sp.]
MPQFAANLSLMYTEYAFLERFRAAAEDGFRAVEFLFPYEYPAEQLRAQLRAHGLQQVLFNAPPGGLDAAAMAEAWARGDRGTGCLAQRQAEFRAGIAHALDYAQALECPRLHVMAGLWPQAADPEQLHATLVDNLRYAARYAQARGVQLLIEPINRRDMPGYYLTHQAQAHALVQAVGAHNLKVQMDLYHCQIVEGDLACKLRQYVGAGAVGHIQIASVPERHEPDGGEINYPYLFSLLDQLGYDGWVGCEYRPRLGPQPGATRAGLGWLVQARAGAGVA